MTPEPLSAPDTDAVRRKRLNWAGFCRSVSPLKHSVGPFDNTESRLMGREQHVVDHYWLSEALEG